MKIFTKILGVLILLGLVMAVAAFFMGLDVTNLRGFFTDEDAYSEMLTEVTDKPITNLIVDLDTRHITINFVTEDVLSVTYYRHESKDVWTFDDSVDGVYRITQNMKNEWFNFMNYKYTPQSVLTVNINIPSSWVLDYDLDTDVGNIRMEYNTMTQVGDLKLYSNTGSIYVKRVDASSLNLKTDTGSVFVSNSTVDGDITLDSDTGTVSLSDATGQSVVLTTDTGNAAISDVTALKLNVRVDTGRVTLKDSVMTENVIIKSSTGDVIITDTSATGFDIVSSTGDVKMTQNVLPDYRYDLKTNTGNIRIGGVDQGNKHSTLTGSIILKISVNTGNIRINS